MSDNRTPPHVDLDEFERRLRNPVPPPLNDPLAELARLVGAQDDPFRPTPPPVSARGDDAASRFAAAQAAYDNKISVDGSPPPLRGAIQPEWAAPASGRGDPAQNRNADPAPSDWSAAPDHAPIQQSVLRPGKRLYVMAAGLMVVIAAGGALAMRGGSASGVKPVATILAAEGPAKIQPQTADVTDARNAEGAGGRASADGGASKVVDHTEQPVDLTLAPKQPRISGQAAMAGVSASDGPAAQPSSGFPEPRKVRTVLIRPDSPGGIRIDAPSSALPPSVNGADAAPSPPVIAPAKPKSVTPVATTPKPVAPKPIAPKTTLRAAAPKSEPTPTDGGDTPLQLSPAPKPKPVRVKTADAGPAAAAPAPSGYAVQFAAPKSEAEARGLVAKVAQKYADILGGRQPGVRRGEASDKSTVYRVRISGLASKDEADALCAQVKTMGGACFTTR